MLSFGERSLLPFAWTEGDLMSALKEAGWEEISVVAYPTRKIRPWLLRCKAPDSVDRVCGHLFWQCHDCFGARWTYGSYCP